MNRIARGVAVAAIAVTANTAQAWWGAADGHPYGGPWGYAPYAILPPAALLPAQMQEAFVARREAVEAQRQALWDRQREATARLVGQREAAAKAVAERAEQGFARPAPVLPDPIGVEQSQIAEHLNRRTAQMLEHYRAARVAADTRRSDFLKDSKARRQELDREREAFRKTYSDRQLLPFGSLAKSL